MKQYTLKKIMPFLALSFATVFLFQNCSAVKFSGIGSVPILANLISNNSGNGGTYDGKLRILHHYVDNFTCEGRNQPEAILIRNNTGAWNLIQNKIDRCGDRAGVPVNDVTYDDTIQKAQYDGKIFVAPKPYYVSATEPANLPDTNLLDGVCEDVNGKCSLLAATQQAGTTTSTIPVIVQVPAGTFNLSGPLDIKFLNSPNSVTVRGADPAQSIIDAKGVTNHFNLSGGGAVSFENLTFINGNNSAMKSASVINLLAYSAQSYAGTINILNCHFKNNDGNPVLFIPTVMGKTTISKSIFDSNGKGSISTEGNHITMTDSTIMNERYTAFIASAAYSTIIMRNSSILNSDGAGVIIDNCYDCVLENVSIYGNKGGGLNLTITAPATKHMNPTVNNSTIYNNAINVGNNLSLYFTDPTSKLILNNSIIAINDTAKFNCTNVYGQVNTIVATNSLFDDASCLQQGTGNISGKPNLLPAAMNGGLTPTLSPAIGSPVIDAGDNLTCASQDQRGFSRPVSRSLPARCDIGAVELQ
ncbi:MAG: right-handed parallel beta-helix repeat-containing protein [Bdellovibrio sp.]|nr:right-handed parallel beta-helix repeat-containing protein [Bdellovibrio sp.]